MYCISIVYIVSPGTDYIFTDTVVPDMWKDIVSLVRSQGSQRTPPPSIWMTSDLVSPLLIMHLISKLPLAIICATVPL